MYNIMHMYFVSACIESWNENEDEDLIYQMYQCMKNYYIYNTKILTTLFVIIHSNIILP